MISGNEGTGFLNIIDISITYEELVFNETSINVTLKTSTNKDIILKSTTNKDLVLK